MYSGIIFCIIGFHRVYVCPFFDFPGKAAQYIAVALHGRYVDGALHAASHFYLWYCATVYTSVPLHDERLSVAVYGLWYDDDFFSDKFAVFIGFPVSGSYDVFGAFQVAECSVFQVVVGGCLESGCYDSPVGLQ